MRNPQVKPAGRSCTALQRSLALTLVAVATVLLNGCAGVLSGTNTPPPTLSITSVQAVSTTTNSSQIIWTTNVAADSAVDYGTTPSYGTSTPVDPTMVTSHQVALSGLAAGTTYYYQVRSTDSKSNHGNSGGHKFGTAGFSVSGTITPSQGANGATVTLSGTSGATTTTNGSGSYTFPGLASGSYVVTPTNTGYTFTPASRNVTVGTTNVTGVDFTASGTTAAPTITTQPASQTVTAGQTATFSVVATGTAPLNYQWQKNGTNISGATSASYTTAATTSADSGSTFDVVVNNSAGSVTSTAATLTVTAAAVAPTITTQPANQTVTAGQTATFRVTATGTAPLSYQWQKNGANITGATSAGYTTPATTAADSGSKFDVVVSNTAGSVTSNAASLTVNAATSGMFGHISIVVEENTNYSSVTSSSMPYLAGLMTQYGLATQYYANTHPSIGNYEMLTTGQVLTNTDTQTPSSFPVSADNVVRELVAAGKTWKAYAESLPSVGYLGGDTTSGGGQYYVRHVPVAYFTDVQNSSAQQQNLVPFTQFATDLAAGNLPNYSFITPNGCDDAHDCALSTADTWLKSNIDPLLKNSTFQKDGLLIVVFDESGNDNTNGGGRVVCALISPAFSKLGYQSTTVYQHQSLLRLTLEGLGVTVLPGASSSAPAMWEFFGTSGGGPSPLAITTTSLPNGTVGQAYSTQLSATGGTSPYSWSISSGSLPVGLSLSPAGVISGTPTAAGAPTFTVSVSDATSQAASHNFTLTVGSAVAAACTLYVSPSGSDSNPGTLSAPWQTPQKAAGSATAGHTVCFRGGTYPQTVTSGYQQTFNNSGSAGNPIVFTNYPGEVALIQGSTRINGSYLTFRGTPQGTGSCDAINQCGLIFEGSQGYNIDGIDICCATNSNSNFVTFDHVEIRKATYHAGLYQEGCNNAIIGSYVHDNGAFNANRSEDNGIYWSVTSPGCTNGGLIANNLVENNYSKGIQLYNGGSATSPAYVTVTENTSVNNGAQGAVVWGDHNVFVNNILYNNNNLSGGSAAGAQAGLYSGSANLLDHNLTFDPTGNSGWDNPAGCCITNNQQGDPLFLNASGLNWHILSTSPAVGFSNMNYIQPVDKDGVSRNGTPAAGAYQP